MASSEQLVSACLRHALPVHGRRPCPPRQRPPPTSPGSTSTPQCGHDELGQPAAAVADDRCPAGQGLGRDQTVGLVPFRRHDHRGAGADEVAQGRDVQVPEVLRARAEKRLDATCGSSRRCRPDRRAGDGVRSRRRCGSPRAAPSPGPPARPTPGRRRPARGSTRRCRSPLCTTSAVGHVRPLARSVSADRHEPAPGLVHQADGRLEPRGGWCVQRREHRARRTTGRGRAGGSAGCCCG